jgi:Tfp pilus assembly protein PilP
MNRAPHFRLIVAAGFLFGTTAVTAAEDPPKTAAPATAPAASTAPAAKPAPTTKPASSGKPASTGKPTATGKNAATAKTAPAPKAPSPGSFEAYQLVVERNIFNPNRVGRTRANPEDKQPRVDEISLVGTMESERGRVAFFESPDSAYRKALREGETMGDFRVRRIANDGVELMREEKALALKISQQLRRPEGGEWTVRATPSAVPEAAAAAAVPEIPADASEVLKRLLKQRESQLKK